MLNDTIAAISTAFGTAGISVIRVSGEDSIKKINQIFTKNLLKVKGHTVHHGHLLDLNGKIVDEVMVSVFKSPNSFTKENVVEISTHGGILITQKALNTILSTGIRLAEPGEFTKRAYLNGRIDLIEAESIMDLIYAKNEQALKIAHLGISKETSALIKDLKNKLLTIIAKIEVNIDYPEYDDAIIMNEDIVLPETTKLLEEIEVILKESNKNRWLKEGIKTAIIGRPNVGKSSLLNALLNEDRAIVTDVAGTTRDTIEASLDLGGIILNLVDTAGIRDTSDIVEQIGVNRSIKALNEAELVLLVLDQSVELTVEDIRLLKLTENKKRIIIANKADLPKRLNVDEVVLISSLQKTGLKDLTKAIYHLLSIEDYETRDFNYLSNARQISKLSLAKDALLDCLKSIDKKMPVDIYAIDLTRAWNLLGEILGERQQDDLLNELFSKFCLGK